MLNDFELKRKEVAALDEIAQTLDKISNQYTYLIERFEEEFEVENARFEKAYELSKKTFEAENERFEKMYELYARLDKLESDDEQE